MFYAIKRILEMNRKTEKIAEVRDPSGKVVVAMTVRDDSAFLSPYSANTEPLLSPEASDFLEHNLRPRHAKEALHVQILSDIIDEGEKPIYETAIRNTFRQKYIAERQKGKRDLFVALCMLAAGILFLVGMLVLEHLGVTGMWLEVVDIFAWVFLWEATDIFFLQRHLGRFEQHRCISFYSAEISFVSLAQVATQMAKK